MDLLRELDQLDKKIETMEKKNLILKSIQGTIKSNTPSVLAKKETEKRSRKGADLAEQAQTKQRTDAD